MAYIRSDWDDGSVEQMVDHLEESAYLWTDHIGINMADSLLGYDDLQGADYGEVSDVWSISDISSPCVGSRLCGDWSPGMVDQTTCANKIEDIPLETPLDDTRSVQSDISDASLLGHVCDIEDDTRSVQSDISDASLLGHVCDIEDDTRSVQSDISDASLLGHVENIESGLESFAMSPQYWVVPDAYDLNWSYDSETLAILDEITAPSNDLMRCDSLQGPDTYPYSALLSP